jgi:hypothetical protein
MFEKFTDRARRVVVLAQEEARALNHNYIGTEHILLGLIHEGQGVGAKALESLGISLDAVRQRVEAIIGTGQRAPSGHIPFTPRAKTVLELSLAESLRLGHNYISTEHILLGLIREGDGVAAQVLLLLGVDLNRVSQRVIELLHGYQGKEPTITADAHRKGSEQAPKPEPTPVGRTPSATRTADSTRTSRVQYADLDLAIRAAGGGSFTVRVLNSPAGQSTEVPFRLPWSELELENFLLRITHQPRLVRRIDSPQVAVVKEFGSRLYKALFSDRLEAILLRSLSEVAAAGTGLRIRLRLSDAPVLGGLPWEFMYDSMRNRFLCLSERTPIVRFLDVPDPPRPLNISTALRILVVISSPSDLGQLDAEQEWGRLTAALAPMIREGAVEVQRLEQGTVAALRRTLRQQDWNVLHFIGHGGFDASIGDGVLIFENEQGRSRIISGEDLGVLLHDHDSLRLVLLNACEGARADQQDPFSGSAQGLVQQGIPAVVAMQFEITNDAAITLASEMYSAICDGYSLEAAVAAARKAIFTDGNQTEWATPVLYLRTADGIIFNIQNRT